MPNPNDLPPRQADRRPTTWPDVAIIALLCVTVVAVAWLVTR